jgi:DNA-binding response OmpR family regulator
MRKLATTHHPHSASGVLAQPDRPVTVLAISPFSSDHVFLRHIFSHSKWRLWGAGSLREAREILRHSSMYVVLCEKELPDCTWKEIPEELAALKDPPPLIVISRLADERLWAEVLNLGGYDVLMKPFDPLEVVRVISLAWRHLKNNWESARQNWPGLRIAAAGA